MLLLFDRDGYLSGNMQLYFGINLKYDTFETVVMIIMMIIIIIKNYFFCCCYCNNNNNNYYYYKYLHMIGYDRRNIF